MRDPNQLDQLHDQAFSNAIQADATTADIDAFLFIHQQVLDEQAAHEQQVIAENNE